MKDEQTLYVESLGDEVERTETGKIRFVASGMEFPSTATVAQLRSYYMGRALRRARLARSNEHYDFMQHAPYIVPHRTQEEKFLFCHLTRAVLPRDAQKVEKHVNGRRYKLRFAEAKAREEERDRIRAKRAKRRAAATKFKEAVDKNADVIDVDAFAEQYKSGDDSDFDPNAQGDDVTADEHNSDMDAEFERETEGVPDALAAAAVSGGIEVNSLPGASEVAKMEVVTAESPPKKTRKAKEEAIDVLSAIGDKAVKQVKVEKKDGDSFWTRGAGDGRLVDQMEDGADTDDEWSTHKRKKGRGKRLVEIIPRDKGVKRKKAPAKVPKKVRQLRMKRVGGVKASSAKGPLPAAVN